MTSVEARDELVRIQEDDLIGPKPGEPHASELLDAPPSRFYLTGFLIPTMGTSRGRSVGTSKSSSPLGSCTGSEAQRGPVPSVGLDPRGGLL